MCLSVAACSSNDKQKVESQTAVKDTSWIAKSDDVTIPTGVYAYYQYEAYLDLVDMEVVAADTPLSEQEVEGTDIIEYIENVGALSSKYLILLETKFEELGLEVSDDDMKAIESEESDAGLAGVEYLQNAQIFEANGITKEDVVRASFNCGLARLREELIFEAIYGPNGTTPTTQSEIEQFAEENYICLSYISEALTEETDEDVHREEFAEIQQKCESGESDFLGLVDEYRAREVENAENLARAKIIYSLTDVEYLVEGLADMENDKFFITTDDEYIYLMQKHDILQSDYLKGYDNQLSIIRNMKLEDFQTKMFEDANKGEKMTVNEDTVSRYSISKFTWS